MEGTELGRNRLSPHIEISHHIHTHWARKTAAVDFDSDADDDANCPKAYFMRNAIDRHCTNDGPSMRMSSLSHQEIRLFYLCDTLWTALTTIESTSVINRIQTSTRICSAFFFLVDLVLIWVSSGKEDWFNSTKPWQITLINFTISHGQKKTIHSA